MRNIRGYLAQKHIQVSLLLFLSMVIYVAILGNGLVWDDLEFIKHWKDIRNLSNIPTLLKGLNPPGHEGVFRPVRNILYAVFYSLWGDAAWGYHLQAILLHGASTYLVYHISRILLKSHRGALITMLFFGLHPVHTEAVSFATASMDLWAAVSMLGAFLMFQKASLTGNIRAYVISAFLTLVALFTNESAMVLPLMYLLYSFMFFPHDKKSIGRILTYIVPLFFLLPVYIVIRYSLAGLTIRENVFAGNQIRLWFLMLRGFYRYVTVLFLPIWLSPHYIVTNVVETGLDTIRLVDTSVIAGTIIGIIAICFAFIFRKRAPVLSFSIFWFLITLLPVSNILPISSLPIAERYLYLPSLGFSLGVGWIVLSVLRWSENKNFPYLKYATLAGIIYIGLLYSFRTFTRTLDWKSSLSLWTAAYSTSPDSTAVANNLAHAYAEAGNLELAEIWVNKALELYPENVGALSNLGGIYLTKKEYSNALKPLEKAFSLEPGNLLVVQNLYLTYRGMDKREEAKRMLDKAYNTKPYMWTANALAAIYLAGNQQNEAISILEKSIGTGAEEGPLNNLGALYNSVGKYEQAVNVLEKALSINSSDTTILINLATAYMNLGRTMDAIHTLEKAKSLTGDTEQIDTLLNSLYSK